MVVVDILNKKRLGKELSYQELDFIFNGYLNGTVKDYQMSSLLMAICINGMSDDEIFALTKIFIDSGDILDLSKYIGEWVYLTMPYGEFWPRLFDPERREFPRIDEPVMPESRAVAPVSLGWVMFVVPKYDVVLADTHYQGGNQ